MACPVCGCQKAKKIGSPLVERDIEKFVRTDYTVVKCKSCGLLYLTPDVDLTPFEMAQIYEKLSTDRIWSAKINNAEKITEKFDKLLNHTGVKEIDFLDVGCGKGETIQEALSRGWNVTAIDYADQRSAKAKTENVSFYEGSLENVNLKSNGFDIVFVDTSLEKSTNPVGFFTKIKSYLKPEGFAYVRVGTNGQSKTELIELRHKTSSGEKTAVSLMPFSEPFELLGFTEEAFNMAVESAGLKIAEYDCCVYDVEHKNLFEKLKIKLKLKNNFIEAILTKV